MLIEFTVGNYRSIAEPVTLSLIAAPLKSGSQGKYLDETNLVRISDKLSLLKVAAIYGANASGKSNLLRALHLAMRFMQLSIHISYDINSSAYPYEPFLLHREYEQKPGHFEIVFLIDNVQYRYGFEISAEKVEREWFYFVPTIRETLLFERDGQNIKVGNSFKGGKGLEPRVSPRALFLSVAREFNVQIARRVFEWVNDCLRSSGLDLSQSRYTIECLENNVNDAEIIDFIKDLDVGISGVQLTLRDSGTVTGNKSVLVETIHRVCESDGQPADNVTLNMPHHESDGTQRVFAMAGGIVRVLKKGGVLVVDEMDARLHPSLTRKIVEIFLSPQTNPKNAQLIFATHDTNLLDKRLLRRDQIWFVEKNRQGATELYSLAEIKVRNDALYEKEYLEGRYGAVPFPGGFERLVGTEEVVHAASE